VEAQLSFTFWAEHGALTLTGYEGHGRGGRVAEAADADATQEALKTVLTQFAQRHTGEVVVRLRRQSGRWMVDYEAAPAASRPWEAKRWPVRREGIPALTVVALAQGLRQLLVGVQVPSGGAVQLELEARLEDERAVGWELLLYEVTRRGESRSTRALSQETGGEALQVLLPFTQGIGERAVRLTVKAEHREGESLAGGWVESAQVLRPPLPHGMDEDFAAEYRALHEDILRRWREDVRENAEWLALQGAEELAVWYVGGILTRGGGLLIEIAGPTAKRALGRGGEAAAGWLRTALVRMPGDEKQTFERLLTKVQLEGMQSLTHGEQRLLREVMERLELLVKTKLDKNAKDTLRSAARKSYKKLHPQFTELLDQQRDALPIHHRCPLDYAHLFPDEDINAAANLAMVQKPIHQLLDSLWGKFRRARPNATADEVRKAADLIDEQFQPWYHQPVDPPGPLKTPQAAQEAALKELQRLFPDLK
jgi:hypothetical protein